MQTYGKSYETDEAEFQRRGIWEMHRKYVEEHNLNADVYGFTTGMNEYADLVRPAGEWVAMEWGWDMNPIHLPLYIKSVSVIEIV